MRKIENWDDIKNTDEVVGFNTLEPGIYVCKILKVEDVVEKEYLKVAFDIVEGDCKGYFKDLFDNDTREDKKWANNGILYRSYKKSAERFFASFITAVEKSNDGYKWDFDESKLKGKLFVANFREEEYINDEGELKSGVKVGEVRSLQALRDNKIKLLEPKKVSEEKLKEYGLDNQAEKLLEIEDDLPF